jgi:hypothetical protein
MKPLRDETIAAIAYATQTGTKFADPFAGVSTMPVVDDNQRVTTFTNPDFKLDISGLSATASSTLSAFNPGLGMRSPNMVPTTNALIKEYVLPMPGGTPQIPKTENKSLVPYLMVWVLGYGLYQTMKRKK